MISDQQLTKARGRGLPEGMQVRDPAGGDLIMLCRGWQEGPLHVSLCLCQAVLVPMCIQIHLLMSLLMLGRTCAGWAQHHHESIRCIGGVTV